MTFLEPTRIALAFTRLLRAVTPATRIRLLILARRRQRGFEPRIDVGPVEEDRHATMIGFIQPLASETLYCLKPSYDVYGPSWRAAAPTVRRARRTTPSLPKV